MTAPVTGPFTVVKYLNGPPTSLGYLPRHFEEVRTSYRQLPPFDLPLEFTFVQRYVPVQLETATGYGTVTTAWNVEVYGMPSSVMDDANLYNEVYKKFKKAMGESVSAGIAFAESRQAMGMITSRLLQVARFTDQVRRGRFGEAAETLGVLNPSRNLVSNKLSAGKSTPRQRAMERGKGKFARYKKTYDTSQSFANHYLEFHFGWVPLMKDIYEAAEALSSPIFNHSIAVKGARNIASRAQVGPSGSNPRSTTWEDATNFQAIRMQAELVVTNPNVALLQQCGLINPLTVLWEKVPFSFVVDWFVNVGDFLSSFTDFAGVQLVNPQRTTFTRTTYGNRNLQEYNTSVQTWRGPPNYYSFHRYDNFRSYVFRGVYCRRVLGMFPGPTLKIRDPWVLSPRRGLAAASLLIQRMPPRSLAQALPVIRSKNTVFRNTTFPAGYTHL